MTVNEAIGIFKASSHYAALSASTRKNYEFLFQGIARRYGNEDILQAQTYDASENSTEKAENRMMRRLKRIAVSGAVERAESSS